MNLRTFIPLVIATLVLIGAASLYGFMYYTLTMGKANVGKLSSQIAQKSYQLERNAAARSALSTLSEGETAINQYSVGKDDVVPFLGALQATGKSVGTTVQVLSVSSQNIAEHSRIALSLSITGSFDAVMRTLGEIEYGPYDGVITSTSLTSEGVGTSSARNWTAATLLSVGTLATTTAPAKP
jgi:hypothetical protein